MSRELPEYNQLMRYTINDVCNWLAENRFGEFVRYFRQNGIDGNRFVTLNDLDLTKMQCPMNKRRDLLKLIKDVQKPTDSRVKGIVQQPVPATPTRDYNAHHTRAPAPIPVQSPQNGLSANDDEGSGPEDDYEWGSDFSDVSSDDDLEDYENSLTDPPRPPVQQPDQDSDSAGSYEEPDPQSAPPPSITPRRGAPAQVPTTNAPRPPVPVNRRPVPQMPPEEDDQPVYEETNDDDDQLLYEDPDEQSAPVVPEPVQRTGRRQLPLPDTNIKTIPRKVPPSLRDSEPEVPAPPPPRGRNAPKGSKSKEPSDGAPAPPPPRGARKPQPVPVPEPEEPQDVYEDPDASQPHQPPQQTFPTRRKASNEKPVVPTQDDFAQDVYEDPDASQPTSPPEPYGRKGSGGQPVMRPKDNFPQDEILETDVIRPPKPPSGGRRSRSPLPPIPIEALQKEEDNKDSYGRKRSHNLPPPKQNEEDDQDVYIDPESVPSSSFPPRNQRSQVPPPRQQEDDDDQEEYLDFDTPTQPKTSGKQQQQKRGIKEVYEDPEETITRKTSVRNSALPPIPKSEKPFMLVSQPVIQEENYVDPSGPPTPPPSRTKMKLPRTPKEKVPHPVKKPPPPEEEPQLEYEVPEELLKGEMPVDDYMEMQATPEERKEMEKKSRVQVLPSNGEVKTHTLPPRPGGKKKALPVQPPTKTSLTQPAPTEERKRNKHGHRPLPQPSDSGLPLEEQAWYFGDIERTDADKKLLEVGTNGCYLLRRSKKGGETKPYTLAIFYSGQVFNLNIRKKPNSKFALGNPKANEQEFSDLPELVSFFNSHRLILAKGQTRLKKPCPK